ncbi:unnamed protein product [Macrosiphum euphorbiae]|uniref:Uncharacterized protein n=1 Tax=Macrosiphum euphorbiae TaxID=13131 RepID=A0AAV0W9F1_9HEMI|nr:unnamed protein product [Macrosiphum euphorbiae]
MKLKCHNLTIYNIAKGECSNYWWHEGEADLEASVFATILIKHLIRKCTENLPIIIYSDGCGYQNRKCVMSNALLRYSIAKNVVIEQKLLIKGHTQMECDSAHSLIERKLKNKDIYLPSDYIRITTEARVKPYPFEAFLLTHSYFYDFKNLKPTLQLDLELVKVSLRSKISVLYSMIHLLLVLVISCCSMNHTVL